MEVPGFPPTTKALRLLPNSKLPDTVLHPHGHLSPRTLADIPEGVNYGIVLDGEYVLYDVDNVELADRITEGYVWEQRTKKGYHSVYRLPRGIDGTLVNSKLKNAAGQTFGDLKTKGYFVGPGSVVDGHTYQYLGGLTAELPEFLKTQICKVRPDRSSSPSIKGIPSGSHDSFLTSLGGWLRGQAALEEPAIKEVLKGAVNVLQDVDESDPYTESDLDRIARSAASYDPVYTIEQDREVGKVRYFNTFPLYQPLQRWLIPYFLPMDTLSLIFGKGGIGKSTLGSYAVRAAVKRDLKVAVSVMEESVELFGARVLYPEPLSRKELGQILELPSGLVFPRDAIVLEQLIEEEQIDVVYFDSIYSHFDPNIEGNEATRARMALSHLAKVAQARNVTVIGVFHENKGGEFLGSVEMRNVCRTLLHATQDTKTKQMKLKVVKSNYEVPDYALLCMADKFVLADSNGTVWEREGEDGEVTPREAYGIHSFSKIGDEDTFEIEQEEDPKEKIRETLRIAKMENPSLSVRQLAEQFGVSKSQVQRLLN